MPTHPKARLAPTPMIMVLFLLSSCGFAYKPVKPTVGGTKRNKMIYTIPLEREGHALELRVGGAKRDRDTGAFNVMLDIQSNGPKDSIHITGLKLTVKDRKRDAQPYALKAASLFKAIDYRIPVRSYNDTTIAGLDLDGGTYMLRYHFTGGNKKRVGKALQIDITASVTQGGKTMEIKQAIGFKRFFWLDIAGN